MKPPDLQLIDFFRKAVDATKTDFHHLSLNCASIAYQHMRYLHSLPAQQISISLFVVGGNAVRGGSLKQHWPTASFSLAIIIGCLITHTHVWNVSNPLRINHRSANPSFVTMTPC